MTSHPSAIMSWKESFMNRWKVAGELVSPKNITVGLKRPLCVMKAAFHWLEVNQPVFKLFNQQVTSFCHHKPFPSLFDLLLASF